MRVRQLESYRGNPWANQFVLESDNKIELQSYSSLVVTYEKRQKPVLHSDWDYSNTTAKAVYKFFMDYIPNGEKYHLRKNMLKAIKNGEVYYNDDIKYKVVQDLQGGEFGMGRTYDVFEWIEQAADWLENDFETTEEREKWIDAMKISASKHGSKDIIDYIADHWQLEFKEA